LLPLIDQLEATTSLTQGAAENAENAEKAEKSRRTTDIQPGNLRALCLFIHGCTYVADAGAQPCEQLLPGNESPDTPILPD